MSKVWVPIDLPEGARVRDIIVEVGSGGPAHTRVLEPLGPVWRGDHLPDRVYFVGDDRGRPVVALPSEPKWSRETEALLLKVVGACIGPNLEGNRQLLDAMHAAYPNGSSPPSPQSEAQRERWEHHIVAIHPDATTELLRDVLNSYGASHWEVASTVTIGGKCAVVVKRRLP